MTSSSKVLGKILGDNNLTQSSVARASNVSQAYVSQVLSGAKLMSPGFAQALSLGLGLDESQKRELLEAGKTDLLRKKGWLEIEL